MDLQNWPRSDTICEAWQDVRMLTHSYERHFKHMWEWASELCHSRHRKVVNRGGLKGQLLISLMLKIWITRKDLGEQSECR